MPLIDELRKELPEYASMSDQDIVAHVSHRLGEDPTAVAGELGIQFNEPGLATSFKRSLASFPAGAGRLIQDFGPEQTQGIGAGLRRYGENVQYRNPSAVNDFEQFGEHPWLGVKEMIGSAAGSTLPALIPYAGPVARVLGPAGTTLAGAAISAVPSYQDIRQTQDQTGYNDPTAALLGSAATGAIEQFGGVQRFIRPGAQVAEHAFASTPFRTGLKAMGRTGLEEGAEELAQNPIEQYAGGQDPTASAQIGQTLFGGFSGFVGGLMPFGAYTGVQQGMAHAAQLQDAQRRIQQGAADRLNSDQPVDLLGTQKVLTGLQRTIDDVAQNGLLQPTEGGPSVFSVGPNGAYLSNDALNAGGVSVLQGLPHESSGAQPLGTDVEPELSRAASIMQAAVQGKPVLDEDRQWADQVLQSQLAPDEYAGFMQSLTAPAKATKPAAASKAQKAPKQPKVVPAPAVEPPFVQAYKQAGGIYSPVQKALAGAQSKEDALNIVRDTLENKTPSQKVLRALEEMHKQLSGQTFTQYLRAKEAQENAEKVRSNAGQVRQGSTQGQPSVQPSAVQSGANLQLNAPPVGAQAQQQAREVVNGANGQVVRPGPQGQQQAPGGPVQEVQTQEGAQRPGAGVQAEADEVVPAEPHEVQQFLLRKIAESDPRKAKVLALSVGWDDGDTHDGEAIAQRLGISRQRVNQILKEAWAKAEEVAAKYDIQPEQLTERDPYETVETDGRPATPQSSLVAKQKDAASAGISDEESEAGSVDTNTGFTTGPVSKVNSPNITGELVTKTNNKGEVTGFGGFIPDQEGQVNERARAFEKATSEGDIEGEAATVWDSFAHHYAAQGEKMKDWAGLGETEQGLKTRGAWTQFYAESKNAKKPDVAQLRRIRQTLKEKYYTKMTDAEAEAFIKGLKPVAIGDNQNLMRAMAARFANGYGSLIKERLYGFFTATSGMAGDALVGKSDKGEFNNQYIMVIREDVWNGRRGGSYPALVERMFHHEIEHIIDDSSKPQGDFSRDPALYDGRRPFSSAGEVFKEVARAMDRGNKWVQGMFSYPMDDIWEFQFSVDARMKELYAQIMSAYHTPSIKTSLLSHLPGAYAFAETYHEKITAELATRSQGQGSEGRQGNAAQIGRSGGFHASVNAGANGDALGPRTPFRAQAHENYAKAIDEVQAAVESGDRVRRDQALTKLIPVGRTPVVLRQVLAEDGSKPFKKSEFVLGQGSTLYLKATDTHQASQHHWAVPVDVLKNLPQLMADPVAIFKSSDVSSDKNSYKVLLKAEVAGKPVVAALRPNQPQAALGGEKAHFTVTVFPLGGGWSQVQKWNDLGLLRYYDDRRSGAVSSETNPQGLTAERGNEPNWSLGVQKAPVKVVSKQDIEWMSPAQYSKGLDDAIAAGNISANDHLPVAFTAFINVGTKKDPHYVQAEIRSSVAVDEGMEATYSIDGVRKTKLVSWRDLKNKYMGSPWDATPNYSMLNHSKGLDDAIAAYPPELKSSTGAITAAVKDTVTNWAKKGLQAVAFSHDLADIAVKEGLKSARGFFDLLNEKGAKRVRLEAELDRIMTKAADLSDRTAVNRFLQESTRTQRWGYKPSWDSSVEVDPVMKSRYDALSPEGQAIVDEVFKYGNDAYNDTQRLVNKEINDEFDAQLQKAATADERDAIEFERTKKLRAVGRVMPKLQGPYSPLKRFGDYVAVAKSQAYLDAERAGDQKALEEMQSDPNHYLVEFHDSIWEAKARARQLAPHFAKTEGFEKQKIYRDVQELPWGAIAKVKSAVNDMPDGTGHKAAMNRLLTDLYLTMLSESSARKVELKRRGVHGEERDMLRSFASQGRASAHFLAALEHNGEIQKRITKMSNETREGESGTREDRSRVFNEIMARYAQGLDYRPTPIADKLMRLTSMWMLITSPAYYLQNSTQPFMMTLPVLSGRFGNGAAWASLTKAYKDVGRFIKNFGHTLEIDKLPISDDEKAMLTQMRNTGRIDLTIAQDLGRWTSSSGESYFNKGVFGKVMRRVMAAPQQVEMLNRITSALAAYRLSKGNLDYTARILDQTHGNYAASNAPRFMHANGAMRLITQFRKFQLIQISMVAKLLKDSFKGSSPEERAVARASLAWLAAHHMVMAGALGLPAANIAGFLMSMVFGDSDEPKDFERMLRKAIGDEDTANLLLKGVPAALGVDVSNRIGMGNAFSVLPFKDVDLTDRDKLAETLLGAAGPFMGGLLPRVADGVGYIRKGDYYKGIESMLPKGLNDSLKAYRVATQGVTQKNNDVVIKPSELTMFDVMTQALGLPSTTFTDRGRRVGDLIENQEFYKDKVSVLKHKYAAAYRENDVKGMTEAREEWVRMMEAQRRNGLKPNPISSLLKAPREQHKREKTTVEGIQVSRGNRRFVMENAEL